MYSDKDVVSLAISEFLEVAIHNIIKMRNIYPDTIFVKKQKYGVIVYKAIHPQLTEYIANCMQAIYKIAKDNQLDKVIICFYESHELSEKIVFDISNLRHVLDRDPFLLDVEKNFRSFFCRLHTMNEYLNPMSDDATFSLQIQTTESSGIAHMEDPAYEHFPWLQINTFYSEIPGADIIPLETVNNEYVNMQIYMEKKV